MEGVCSGAFVKCVNQGYTRTQYASTGDVPTIELGISPVRKRL